MNPSPVAPQPRPEQLGPCPVCGKEEYHWGKLDGESVLRFYAPDGSRWDRKTRHGGEYIKTRVCMNCGNVQMFVKPKREKSEGEDGEESGEEPTRFVATRPSSRPSPRPPRRKPNRRPGSSGSSSSAAPKSSSSSRPQKAAPHRPKPKP